jgi:hypothetical protein
MDIGKEIREVEFEPVEQPAPAPEPEPVAPTPTREEEPVGV